MGKRNPKAKGKLPQKSDQHEQGVKGYQGTTVHRGKFGVGREIVNLAFRPRGEEMRRAQRENNRYIFLSHDGGRRRKRRGKAVDRTSPYLRGKYGVV